MSNSTLKVAAAKTKLAPSHTIIRAAAISGVMLCMVVFLYKPSLKTAILQTEKARFTLEVARTEEARLRGLSGRQGLAPNTGMLFVFDVPSVACMWMKEMRLSIDILWLDAEKRVTHIEKDVSPETYPNTFCPNQPAKYVVELNAGDTSRASIRSGQKLSF